MLDALLRHVHLVVGASKNRRETRLQAAEAALGFRLPQQLPQPAALQDGRTLQIQVKSSEMNKTQSASKGRFFKVEKFIEISKLSFDSCKITIISHLLPVGHLLTAL